MKCTGGVWLTWYGIVCGSVIELVCRKGKCVHTYTHLHAHYCATI